MSDEPTHATENDRPKTWRVFVDARASYTVNVEASSEEEAIRRVYETHTRGETLAALADPDVEFSLRMDEAQEVPAKRVLMTEPHDGHPDTEECPGCPHPERRSRDGGAE